MASVKAVFVVTAIRDAPEDAEAPYEVAGKVDVSDPVTLEFFGDIGRRFTIELTSIEEGTEPDVEPEGELIE